MLKALVSIAILSASSLVQAAPERFDLSYQGFTVDGIFDASKSLHYQFEVEDMNQDGIYSLAELRSLTGQNMSYPNCFDDHGGCYVEAFNYVAGGALTLSASEYWTDHMVLSGGSEIISGRYYSEYYYAPSDSQQIVWYWSADTRTTITQVPIAPPVPEPTTYAMLGAGLALLGFARRRRR